MKTLKETWTKLNAPTLKFAETWRDCVPVIDTPDGFIKMLFIKSKVNKIDPVEMSLCGDKFPVEYTMTEDEVGNKVLSMFEEFPEFEKMPYPEDYSKHPSCTSDEVWDCTQVNRGAHRVAQVTRRGRGNIIFDNRIVTYIGSGKMFNAIDAGIAVAHHNGMYGIATIPNWKDYGVILK
jgi:hypothetical protein